jgi:hypothetical protein
MEAGIEPSPPVLHHVKFYTTVVELGTMYDTLTQLSYHMQVKSELRLIETLLTTINSHLQIAVSTMYSPLHKRDVTWIPTQFQPKISIIHSSVWEYLSKPLNSNTIRNYVFNCLILLEKVISVLTNISVPSSNLLQFIKPIHPNFPSVHQQVVSEPSAILDPYEVSLKSNYYFPIFDMSSVEEIDDNSATAPQNAEKLSLKSPVLTIAQEDSIDVITDILADM